MSKRLGILLMLACDDGGAPNPGDGGDEGEAESEGEGSADLELTATIDVPSGVRDVAFRGTSLLVLGLDDLTVYDVSNPVNPADLGSTGWGGEGMYIDEKETLFVATGMTVIEATLDATVPAQQFEYTFGPRAATRVFVLGNSAYVASQNDMLALDLSAKKTFLLGSVGIGGIVHDVATNGDLVFNAASDQGLVTIDVSTFPPQVKDFYQVEVEGDVLAVFPLGGALVMAGATEEFSVNDFADPSHPDRLSRTFVGGRAFVLAAGRLYFIGEPCGSPEPALHVFDVADPTAPVELECHPMPDGTPPELRTEPENGRGLAVVGILIAVATDLVVQLLELP